jgi:hypothetical protein
MEVNLHAFVTSKTDEEPRPLYLRAEKHGVYQIWDWMDSKVGPDEVAKRKVLPCHDSNSVRLAHNLVTVLSRLLHRRGRDGSKMPLYSVLHLPKYSKILTLEVVFPCPKHTRYFIISTVQLQVYFTIGNKLIANVSLLHASNLDDLFTVSHG